MANTKMTKKEMFVEVIALATEMGREDIIEFANHEIELLGKKSSKKKEISDADMALMNEVLEALEGCEPMTCTEIITALGKPGISPSKMRAILTKCGDKVVNTKKGKKSVFALA